MLSTVIASGTGTAADIGCPAAGKTGTTDDQTDAWFVGYTPRISTAVWTGYPASRQSMGPSAFGGTYAAPIWHEFMSAARGSFCGGSRADGVNRDAARRNSWNRPSAPTRVQPRGGPMSKVIAHLRAQWMGALALFLVIAGGTAYAANTIGSSDVIDESLLSRDIKNGQVKTADIGSGEVRSADVADNNLTGADVAANSLKGPDIDESTLDIGTRGAGICPGDLRLLRCGRDVLVRPVQGHLKRGKGRRRPVLRPRARHRPR